MAPQQREDSIFLFKDYKNFLSDNVKKNSGRAGYKSRLAAAAGCQRSYLSQVLNSHVHLTVDHAACLADFWDFNEEEAEYFLDLVLLARAGSVALKRSVQARIDRAYKKRQKVEGRVGTAYEPPIQHQAGFYSKWYVSAVYMLVGQGLDAGAVCQRLNLSEKTVLSALDTLESMELVRQDGKAWKKTQHDIYLKDSVMKPPYLVAWRNVASLRVQDEAEGAVHYTNLFSLSGEDLAQIRELFLQVIERSREIAIPSPREEELVCVNVDIFQI